MKTWRSLALLTITIAVSLLASAQEPAADGSFFEIRGKIRRERVAVPAFTGDAPAAAALTGLMRAGLGMTGMFELVDPAAYPAPVSSAAVEDFAGWKLLGADLAIRGQVTRLDTNKYQVELRCYSIRQEKMVLGKRYSGGRDLFNRIVLRFLDELIGWLTGTPGALDARIAYVSNVTGRNEIHVMDTDGSHDLALTNNRTLNLSPAWSPDGRYLLFTGYRARNPDLYIADLVQGKEFRFYSAEGLNMAGDWSPDGRTIAFSKEDNGNLDLYLIGVAGKALRRLTSSPGADISPAWSPDSRFIAFVSDRAGSPQLYLLNLARGAESGANPAARLTPDGSYNSSPAWSPDGKYIAYTGRMGGQFELFLLDMTGAGRTIRRLTATAANEENPSWSPDSRFLAYDSTAAGNYDIYIMSIYGGTPRRITQSPAKDRMPVWSPRVEN